MNSFSRTIIQYEYFSKYLLDSFLGEVLFRAGFYNYVFKLYIHSYVNLLEELTEH